MSHSDVESGNGAPNAADVAASVLAHQPRVPVSVFSPSTIGERVYLNPRVRTGKDTVYYFVFNTMPASDAQEMAMLSAIERCLGGGARQWKRISREDIEYWRDSVTGICVTYTTQDAVNRDKNYHVVDLPDSNVAQA